MGFVNNLLVFLKHLWDLFSSVGQEFAAGLMSMVSLLPVRNAAVPWLRRGPFSYEDRELPLQWPGRPNGYGSVLRTGLAQQDGNRGLSTHTDLLTYSGNEEIMSLFHTTSRGVGAFVDAGSWSCLLMDGGKKMVAPHSAHCLLAIFLDVLCLKKRHR